MTKADFSELVDWRIQPSIRDACGRMYEQGAVVGESRPRPDKGQSLVENPGLEG